MTTALKILRPGDEEALERFLRPLTDTSMFLRSNLREAGLEASDAPHSGVFAAMADDGGEIVAACQHSRTGYLALQAPRDLAEVLRGALDASDRPLLGFTGPFEQVVKAAAVLGLTGDPACLITREPLFTLALADLRLPERVARRELCCRAPRPDELELLSVWRLAYSIETLHLDPDTPDLAGSARRSVERADTTGRHWVLYDHAQPESGPVSYGGFNAALPDAVQVGGVWTPPALRRRGYGRSLVATILREAAGQGVTRAVLFTEDDNLPAQRAYRALGFEQTGLFGMGTLMAPRRF